MGTDMNQSEVLLDQKVAFLRTTAAYAQQTTLRVFSGGGSPQ